MKLNCGDICPKSGSYKVIDGKGNVVNSVYVDEGDTMPPYAVCGLPLRMGKLNIKGSTINVGV